jgi:hypothetical protein
MTSQTVSYRSDIPTTGPTDPADPTDPTDRCARLRALHLPGTPVVIPNAWDVASARPIADTGFPVVGTTSAGVAAELGYPDHEGAPGEQMLTAAARITGAVDVPVTVDAEACGVPEVEPGSLTSDDRWSDMIPACRCGCCT